MATSLLGNSFFGSLVAEHRAWLSAFDPQYLGNWEKLLKDDEEAALTEAGVRRLLQQRNVNVRPNEDLTGKQQRSDFHCQVSKGHFYVEATCISVEKATEITGLVDGANVALRPSSLNRKVFWESVSKAKQVSNHDAPVLVAIGTFHGVASMVSFSPPYLDMLLTGSTTMTVAIDKKTLQSSDLPLETDLSWATFLKPDAANGIGFARSSISGLLLCGLSLEPTWVVGVLHPNPARSFDSSNLPMISFGKVQIDRQNGSLSTKWIGGSNE